MKTELVNVTPAIAREWLKRNTDNRPLRPGHVETLRASFERGEYVQTHQGVAFDDAGILIDGQHRLTAISLLDDPAAMFPMLVTHGLDRSRAFQTIDATQAKRSMSDAIGVDPAVGTTATFLARLCLTEKRPGGLTPQQVAPFVSWSEPHMRDLMAFCGTCARTWSSAPVRSAAIISMASGHHDYAMTVYRSLVLADFDSMPPVAQALYRAHVAGSVRAAAGMDVFVRCMKVFDPAYGRITRVLIKDISSDLVAARERVRSLMAAPKKKAPRLSPSGARMSASGRDYHATAA